MADVPPKVEEPKEKRATVDDASVSEEKFPDDDPSKKQWHATGFKQWSANPLQRRSRKLSSAPPMQPVKPIDGFGELIDVTAIRAPTPHISQEVAGGFGELLDPTLITDTAEPAARKIQPDPPVATPTPATAVRAPSKIRESVDDLDIGSPRALDMTGLLAAAKDLEDVEDDPRDMDNEEVDDFVGQIDPAGLDDVDEADSAGIMSPRK